MNLDEFEGGLTIWDTRLLATVTTELLHATEWKSPQILGANGELFAEIAVDGIFGASLLLPDQISSWGQRFVVKDARTGATIFNVTGTWKDQCMKITDAVGHSACQLEKLPSPQSKLVTLEEGSDPVLMLCILFADSELLRQSISELRAQCEGLPSEPAEEVVLRGLGLPRREQSLQEIMERLKMEKDFVLAELMEDEKQLEARRRAEELSLQLKTLEEAQPRLRERAAKVEQEKSLEGDAISGLEDLRAEDGWGEGMADGSAIALQTENQLLKRQQVEWRRSQTLMLRLAEDMQKRPPKATPDDEGP
eukprot:g1847.t1